MKNSDDTQEREQCRRRSIWDIIRLLREFWWHENLNLKILAIFRGTWLDKKNETWKRFGTTVAPLYHFVDAHTFVRTQTWLWKRNDAGILFTSSPVGEHTLPIDICLAHLLTGAYVRRLARKRVQTCRVIGKPCLDADEKQQTLIWQSQYD